MKTLFHHSTDERANSYAGLTQTGGLMQGIYREGGWAQVTDGKNEIPIPRGRYEDQNYHPPFDELPTKEEYLQNLARDN